MIPPKVESSLDGAEFDGNAWVYDMTDIKIRDLWVRHGVSEYVYCHQGGCEHVLIIADIRLPCKYDVMEREVYPATTFLKQHTLRRCGVCEDRNATVVTYDDIAAPTSPCFLCDSCMAALHPPDEPRKDY